MIITHNFASDLLEKIEGELNKHEKNIKIRRIPFLGKRANFKWLRKIQNYSLPIFSCSTTEVIQITNHYYEILTSDWEKKHPKLVQEGVEQTIESMLERDFPEETIHTAISNKVSKLIYEYDLVLKATKKTNHLFGIEDEEKILLIHLNKYNELINSDTEQIDFINGITLNKKISDLILNIYIRFIYKRLSILNPELTEIKNSQNKKLTKILWRGNQKELCELFIELQNKGWIDDFKYGERSKVASSICNLFDLTLTKRGDNSNTENSFYQILKGTYNRKTQKRDYIEILGENKERKFNKIKQNG